MEKVILDLKKLVSTLYDIDLNEHKGFGIYHPEYLPSPPIDVNDKEVKAIIEHFNLDNCKIIKHHLEDILKQVKLNAYQITYVKDYYEELIKELSRDIIESL